MTDFEKEYAEHCTEHGTPERIELLLCDINGVLRGKWLPGDQAAKLAAQEVRLPISTYAPTIMGTEPPQTGLGIVAGDPDGFMLPVAGTLKSVPWAKGKVAQVLVEMADHPGKQEISPLSSRSVLHNIIRRYKAAGLRPVVASELEFYLITPRSRAEQAPSPPELLPQAQNYELAVQDRFANVLTDIQHAAARQGLDTDTLIAEFGPGQFEINFHHGSALDAADTALFFRRLVRGVAARHKLEASFMAKPYANEPGNGMHVHASVLDQAEGNIFDGSEKLKAAVAGTLNTMAEMQAIFAPHLNSYRRFAPQSFAPASPDWGFDNRAAAIRLPQTEGKGARLEHRISGADVNPYLAIGAILGGILHGLETDLPLPPPLDDPASSSSEPLGQDWAAAIDRLEQSEFAKNLLGAYLRDIFVAVKREEIIALTAQITPAEYRYYLTRF